MGTILQLAFLLLLSLPLSFAYAEESKGGEKASTKELEMRYYRGGDPTVRFYFEKPLTEKWSFQLSAFRMRGWEEVTIGHAYNISKEMSVGVGIGTSRYMASNETARSSHTTLSAFWFWKSDDWEAEVLAEKYKRDALNPTYVEGYIQRRMIGDLSVGAFAQKDLGWGPRFSYKVSDAVSFWATPLLKRVGNSGTTAMIGVKISF